MTKIIFFSFFLFAAMGCKQKGLIMTPDFKSPGPPALVYQTKKDYSNYVSVTLSADKKTIVSYPAPSDVQSLPKPTLLHKSWYLDNRGINEHVAFLNITWEEYAKLQEAPALDTLFSKIIDADPLVSMCNCGLKKAIKDPEKEINLLIEQKKLTQVCKPIK